MWRSAVRLASALAALAAFAVSSARAGETLYNGVTLPDTWPPKIEQLTREPMPVPYLAHRPEIIPIDVGRQLFVDDFLIENTTLHRTYHPARYHPACPVLRPDRPWESASRSEAPPRPIAMVFSDGVWYDPADRLFKMWYMAGACNSTCYATSKDGIYWDKPALDVVPGTNIVMDRPRDSSTVWIDHNERNPARRYKMLSYHAPKGRPDFKTNPWHSAIYYSADGIHWSEPVATRNEQCDRSTFFYNPFRDRWVFSLRAYLDWPIYRCRYYAESKDFDERYPQVLDGGTPWTCSDHLDPRNPNPELRDVSPQLYNLDAVGYESIMLGLFSIWEGQLDKSRGINKREDVVPGYSRDGFHWQRPDRRPFIAAVETDGAWNYANVQTAGGTCLAVGDQLYFYISGRGKMAATAPCSTGLAVLRRDGFASMDAAFAPGALTTRLVTFKGKHLFVNTDTARGELRVEVLDRDGAPIAGFGVNDCLPVAADRTIQAVRWREVPDLSALSGKPVRFRFHLKQGKLYAFWVSPQASGASQGYVAAGGPGYTGPVDTVGTAALAAASDTAVQNTCPATAGIECPAWAKETVPAWVQPYLGKYGLPAPFPQQKQALGNCTAGIDMWQANHFVGYGPQTARYLYEEYTPLTVQYKPGPLPWCEKIAAQYTAGLSSDRDKVLALLTRAIPEQMAHPSIPPFSADVRPDRAMSEDDLLKSGLGWCNEQARVFVRLCQISGIPARLIFLFFSNNDGHVVAEFYVDGRWSMADSSWGCVFPASDGHLMSAAECHETANKLQAGQGYVRRIEQIVAYSDEMLSGRRYQDIKDAAERARITAREAAAKRKSLKAQTAQEMTRHWWAFGVMNLPLPQ